MLGLPEGTLMPRKRKPDYRQLTPAERTRLEELGWQLKAALEAETGSRQMTMLLDAEDKIRNITRRQLWSDLD